MASDLTLVLLTYIVRFHSIDHRVSAPHPIFAISDDKGEGSLKTKIMSGKIRFCSVIILWIICR